MEDWNVEFITKSLLNNKTLRRADIFKIYAAKSMANTPDTFDKLFRVLFFDLNVERVDIGKPLEQNRLPFHDGFRGCSAQITQSQNGCPVGNDGHHIALGSILINEVRVFSDFLNRHRNAGRICQRQISLGHHRLCRLQRQFSGNRLCVKFQSLLVGYIGFTSQFLSLASKYWPLLDIFRHRLKLIIWMIMRSLQRHEKQMCTIFHPGPCERTKFMRFLHSHLFSTALLKIKSTQPQS